MQIDLNTTPLRTASPSDWRQVADITAEAFAEDPVNLWLFRKLPAIRSMFRVMAREMYLKHGQCFLAGDDGATMWMPPGVEAAPSNFSLLKFALGQFRHGTVGAIKRGLAVSELMDKWHPSAPHMYLFTIGTRQSARGKGVGKALLAPVLAACDRDGIPAYLENSNPANSGFYGAYGFERMGVFEVGDGGPVMEPMWREAKR